MKIIKNACLYTMAGDIFKNGIIAFDDKIRYVGADMPEVSDTDRIIDAHGNIVPYEYYHKAWSISWETYLAL